MLGDVYKRQSQHCTVVLVAEIGPQFVVKSVPPIDTRLPTPLESSAASAAAEAGARAAATGATATAGASRVTWLDRTRNRSSLISATPQGLHAPTPLGATLDTPSRLTRWTRAHPEKSR